MTSRKFLFSNAAFIAVLHFGSCQSSSSAVEIYLFIFSTAVILLLLPTAIDSGGRVSLFYLLYRRDPSFATYNRRFRR
jgi:hypothetical protein